MHNRHRGLLAGSLFLLAIAVKGGIGTDTSLDD